MVWHGFESRYPRHALDTDSRPVGRGAKMRRGTISPAATFLWHLRSRYRYSRKVSGVVLLTIGLTAVLHGVSGVRSKGS
jgi:hypothetical protein